MCDCLYACKILWLGRSWKLVVRASAAAIFVCELCFFCVACNFCIFQKVHRGTKMHGVNGVT